MYRLTVTDETLQTLNLNQIILLCLAIKVKSWCKSYRGCIVIFLTTQPVHFYLGRWSPYKFLKFN
jgi:hypothetical protein